MKNCSVLPASHDSTSTDDEGCLCIAEDVEESSSACSTPCPSISSTDIPAKDMESRQQQQQADDGESVVVLLEGRQGSPTLSLSDDGYCSSSTSSIPGVDHQLPFADFDNVNGVVSLEASSEPEQSAKIATVTKVSSLLDKSGSLACPL